MVTFFFKFKKSYFTNFWGKKSFSTKSSCYAHNLLQVSGTMPKFREIQWSNLKKTPKQISGGKDGQTLFHRIIPATALGLTSKTAKNWHLKVKDIVHNVGLTKSYASQSACKKSA